MSDQRPYVVPRITDRGTILLLDDEQHEFHLQPHDAAELAIQILRSYCQTYGFAVRVPIPNGTVSGSVDMPTLGFAKHCGMVICTLKSLGSNGTSTTKGVFEQIKDIVLAGVRSALGVTK